MDLSAGTVRVVVAHLPIGGVMVQHRIHIARANGKTDSRPARKFSTVRTNANPAG